MLVSGRLADQQNFLFHLHCILQLYFHFLPLPVSILIILKILIILPLLLFLYINPFIPLLLLPPLLHFPLLPLGGRGVIDGIEKNLQLTPRHVEASRHTLYTYGTYVRTVLYVLYIQWTILEYVFENDNYFLIIFKNIFPLWYSLIILYFDNIII